ncbi:RluA family pseudouridine synthase [Fusobacterium necrophorum]|uniref:RluA family pseudouridine synthase n=1 Tax=Fusobacterium necrophorum TaxID=859 RepID=UPI0004804BF6|nr:RluA family pseudouridine synthase [Fusobacterium necrophorum]KYM43904.1 pseudouridine synthase [Fusobacterium necrophorum subsp. funduliforme]
MKEYQVEEKYIGVRVDRYLRKEFPDLSLGDIFKALRTGKIKVNGKRVKENYRFVSEDWIQLYLEIEEQKKREFLTLSSEERAELEEGIFYQDQDILVYYKKAGELMHKGSSHDYGLAEQFQAYFQNEDFHFVNRLDKETSGLVLGGKCLKIVRELAEAIKKRTIVKKYYIIVEGNPPKNHFSLRSYLKKGESRVLESQCAKENYRECSASFQVLKRKKEYSLLEANLETGRTHQLRVQLAGMGFPILGDGKYGKKKAGRMYLHSHLLKISAWEQEWDTGIPAEFLWYFNK